MIQEGNGTGSRITLLRRVGLFVLGGCLVLSIKEIGATYFSDYRTEYGWDVNVFGHNEGAFFFLYTFLGVVGVVLMSLAVGPSLRDRLSRIDLANVNPARIALFLAIGAFFAAFLCRFVVFLEAPLTDDENAYVFASRIIASGNLTLPGYPESLRPFLSNQFVIMGDRVFTQYYPGYPLVLALPVQLGVEWMVNPLASALGIFGTYLLGEELSRDRWTGLVAAVLLFLSPTYILTAGTLFSHPVASAWGVWGLLLVWRGRERNRWYLAALGAIFLGMLLWTRPLSGAVCGVVGAWMLFTSGRSFRGNLRTVVPAAVVAIVFGSGILVYHALTTGDPLVSGYSYFKEYAGVQISDFQARQFTSGDWLRLLAFPLIRFNSWILGWPASIFLLLFVPRGTVRMYGFMVVIGIWLAHLPWTATGVNLTGAVHYFEAMPMIAVLSAAGFLSLIRSRDRSHSWFAVNSVVFSVVLCLAVFYPWATTNLHRVSRYNDTPYRIAANQANRPAVIFSKNVCHAADGGRHMTETWTYYRRNNSVALDDDILWLNERGAEDLVAIEKFPGRSYYRLMSGLSGDGRKLLFLNEITIESLEQEVSEEEPPESGVNETEEATKAITSDSGGTGPLPDVQNVGLQGELFE